MSTTDNENKAVETTEEQANQPTQTETTTEQVEETEQEGKTEGAE